jgi:hypothetical protein
MQTLNAAELRAKIRNVLQQNDGCSLDNPNDRASVTIELLHAIETYLLTFEIEVA